LTINYVATKGIMMNESEALDLPGIQVRAATRESWGALLPSEN